VSERHAVSVKAAADLYEVSQDTIYKAINTRALPAKKVGRALRVNVMDLRTWFDSLDDASPAAEDES
jgi:hypothetical protein